jgi:hypothetical protein
VKAEDLTTTYEVGEPRGGRAQPAGDYDLLGLRRPTVRYSRSLAYFHIGILAAGEA